MTDPAPLTDEELDRWDPFAVYGAHLYHCRHLGWLVGAPSVRKEYDSLPSCDCGFDLAKAVLGRLIAALHAERAKVGELQGILIDNIHDIRTALHGSSSAAPYSPKEAHRRTVQEVSELRAEVERLRRLVRSGMMDPS